MSEAVENKNPVDLQKAVNFWHDRSEEYKAERDAVQSRLDEAEKVIQFYADKKNWWELSVPHRQTADSEYPGIIMESDITKDDFITEGEYKRSGGKLAREYFAKKGGV